MDKLNKNSWNVHTLTTPIGTKTVNSRQSTTISDISGASEVIICVRTAEDGNEYQSYFRKHGTVAIYSDYVASRPPSSEYGFTYDVQWLPESNEVNIRSDVIGSSVSNTGYPKIYEVMYR